MLHAKSLLYVRPGEGDGDTQPQGLGAFGPVQGKVPGTAPASLACPRLAASSQVSVPTLDSTETHATFSPDRDFLNLSSRAAVISGCPGFRGALGAAMEEVES